MIFDLFDGILNSEMFCFFHNCMWQSWNSIVNVELLHLYGSLRSCLIFFFNSCKRQHATLCGFKSTHGSLRSCWVLDVLVIKQNTFLNLRCGLLSTYGSLRSWWLGFWFWLDSLVFFAGSNDFWIQLFHPIVFTRTLRWWSKWHIYFLVCDFSRFHHNNFRDTISWECIAKDDCITSCLIELQSSSLSKLKSTQYTVSKCFALLLVRCKTWFGQIKLLGISVILIRGIHSRKEYRLSFPAWSLSSRYQSRICDGVQTYCTSNMIDVLEEIVRN